MSSTPIDLAVAIVASRVDASPPAQYQVRALFLFGFGISGWFALTPAQIWDKIAVGASVYATFQPSCAFT